MIFAAAAATVVLADQNKPPRVTTRGYDVTDEVTDDAIEAAAEDARRAAEVRKLSFLRLLWPWRK